MLRTVHWAKGIEHYKETYSYTWLSSLVAVFEIGNGDFWKRANLFDNNEISKFFAP